MHRKHYTEEEKNAVLSRYAVVIMLNLLSELLS